MNIRSRRKAKKTFLTIAILGFALLVLSGCGRGYGPYQHGYNNPGYYRGSHGYNNYSPNANGYNDGYGMGYGYGRGGYCW
jgi:hypothetical protein